VLTAFVAAAAFSIPPPMSSAVRVSVFPVSSCAMKRAFFFHRPLVGVEGGFGDVVEDLHTGVLVPLAHDASRPTAIFWLHIRAGAVGVCVIFIWLFNLIVALAFPSLLSALGAGPNFVFFAVMTALAFLFVKKLVPETKGRSLEAIERDLLHGASAPTGAT